MSVSTPALTADAEDLLRAAHKVIAERFGLDEPLSQAVLHLINCAADAVALLPDGHLDAAQEVLRCARAAVGAATYAARRVHDDQRMDQS
jgi:hypothetical protein